MAASALLPDIRDHKHHRAILERLPGEAEPWPHDPGSVNDVKALPRLSGYFGKKGFKWPKKPVVFISDPHADAEAFEASLISAGVVRRFGAGLGEYSLTKFGKQAEIIIGGDCLDKGPSNLAMLRSLAHLYRIRANVTLLAGNHDLRLLMGLQSLVQDTDTGSQHLFVRMGKKVIPLFREVFDQYLAHSHWQQGTPPEHECRQALFPDDDWPEQFALFATGFLTAEGIEREVAKMRNKMGHFQQECEAAGLSLRQVYAAALKCRALFLHPKGEFSWFFREMRLVKQRGSFLFLHAGLDDAMAELLAKQGIKHANRAFRRNLMTQHLFNFYYSPLANTFRTKYRKADLPLTERGQKAVRKAGIRVLVHGHVNQHQGQRIALKNGLIHVEADITLDAHSRQREGLEGYGFGATLIDKQRGLIGLSCDYPRAKVLRPAGR